MGSCWGDERSAGGGLRSTDDWACDISRIHRLIMCDFIGSRGNDVSRPPLMDHDNSFNLIKTPQMMNFVVDWKRGMFFKWFGEPGCLCLGSFFGFERVSWHRVCVQGSIYLHTSISPGFWLWTHSSMRSGGQRLSKCAFSEYNRRLLIGTYGHPKATALEKPWTCDHSLLAGEVSRALLHCCKWNRWSIWFLRHF